MANMLNIPVLGLVENMSYLECPDCGKKINVFGESKIEETARTYYLKVLDKLPINPKIATAADQGTIETIADDYLQNAQEVIENTASRIINIFAHTINMNIAAPNESGNIAEHFGQTKQFAITTVKEGRVIEKNIIDMPGDGHDALALSLMQNNVQLLICGGIGAHAKKALNAAGITIVSGANGDIDQAVKNYILGKLKDDPKAGCAGGGCSDADTDDCGCASGGCH
jgi:predicted Fe-Mo cluster-binding NifX family protein